MDIEDEVGRSTIRVGNFHESRTRTVRYEGLRRGVVISREKDELGSSTVAVLA